MVRSGSTARKQRIGRQVSVGSRMHAGPPLRLGACDIRRHLCGVEDQPTLGRCYRLLGGDSRDVVHIRAHHDSERQDTFQP